MGDFPLTLLAFVVTLGVLITVHEWGHFWVARKLGVKVLRFSIGFGTPLWQRLGRDGTEYVVAALPLGGYVKMLDEREGEVPPEELHRAFNRQSLRVRSAIVAAGPLCNLLFAVAAFWGVLVYGDTGLRPLVGRVIPDSIAEQAGFREGDEILAVAGRVTPTWGYALQELTTADDDDGGIGVTVRDADGNERLRRLSGEGVQELLDRPDLLRALGLSMKLPEMPAVIGEVLSGEAADQAGLRGGDRILELDGAPVARWNEFVTRIRELPGRPVELLVERDGMRLPLTLIVGSRDEGGQRVGRIGAAVRESGDDQMAGYRVEVRLGPVDALGEAVLRTWDTSGLLLRTLGRLVTGRASMDNLGGPIAIAQTAGKSASYGVVSFLKFLASISIILGVMNLLPIPVLDGGHLLFFFMEAVKGSPLAEETMLLGQKVGLALLAALMVLVFYLDISRLFG